MAVWATYLLADLTRIGVDPGSAYIASDGKIGIRAFRGVAHNEFSRSSCSWLKDLNHLPAAVPGQWTMEETLCSIPLTASGLHRIRLGMMTQIPIMNAILNKERKQE